MRLASLDKTRSRIGLALGGGAARGLAHLGVIQVLEENGIEVHGIAGTSMGAIVGAIYLMENNSARVVERMNEMFASEAFLDAGFDVLREQNGEADDNWFESVTALLRRGIAYSRTVRYRSIIERDTFERIINELVPDILIEDMPKPFAAVSLDVTDGREIVWNKGSLRNALWSSSAIPGFFPPLELDGHVLVDGAWTNTVPVDPAISLGATRVIAVDISREIEEMLGYKRGVNLILRAAVLTGKHLRERQLKDADLVLKPDVGHIHWADFQNPDAMIQKGRDAALINLDRIRALHRAPPPWAKNYLSERIRKTVGARQK